jgi:hypothetical protein
VKRLRLLPTPLPLLVRAPTRARLPSPAHARRTTARARSVAPPVAAHRSAWDAHSTACAPRREQGLRYGKVVRWPVLRRWAQAYTRTRRNKQSRSLALRLRCSTMLVRARSATLPTRTLLEGVGRL